MPAVPALIMGGSALVSSVIGSKSASDTSDKLSKRTPEELALMKSQTGLADQQRQQGADLFGKAMPAVNSTLNYYKTLLSGNRSARMTAAAPEAQDVAHAYEGADLALERSGVGGGSYERQKAENARGKAGAVARLITGVRPQAAAATGSMAQGLVGASTGANASAGSIYSGLLGNESSNRQQAGYLGLQQGNKTTSGIGALVANLMNGYGDKLGKGKWGFGAGGGGNTGWDIGGV